MKKELFALFFFGFGMLLPSVAFSASTRIVTIQIPGGDSIEKMKDHFKIGLEKVYLNADVPGIHGLLSSPKSAVIRTSGQVISVNGKRIAIENSYVIDDPERNMQRMIGVQKDIFRDIPGDISSISLSLKISIANEDSIGRALTALNSSSANLPAQVLSAPWIGYAGIASSLTSAFFDTSKDLTPIYAEKDLEVPQRESYVVLVSTGLDKDREFNTLSESEFSYGDGNLKYKGNPINKWTYVVYKISHVSPRDVHDLAQNGYESPWVTVANTQIDTISPVKIAEAAQVGMYADQLEKSLGDLRDFMNADASLSSYDKAVGLVYYGNIEIDSLRQNCQKFSFSDSLCPVKGIERFVSSISKQYKISAEETRVAVAAINFRDQIKSAASAGGADVAAVAGLPSAAWEKIISDKKFGTVPLSSAVEALKADAMQNPKKYKSNFDQIRSLQVPAGAGNIKLGVFQ